MKKPDIQHVVEVVNGLLHCLELSNSPSAQENILAAIRTTLNILDRKESKYQDFYERDGKIPAIREYRADNGCGLAEAKTAIEKLAEENGWINPFRSRQTV